MSIFRGPSDPDKPHDREEQPGSSPGPAKATGRAPEPEAPPPTTSGSYLGPGCVFEGEIRGKGSLECHGTVQGVIELDGEILIGERGTAKADLTGSRIVVDGNLEGDAVGTEKVQVGATGQVHGDIRAPSVGFAEGAYFEGNVEMGSGDRKGSGD